MLDRILPPNMHPVERIARIVVGIALLFLVFIGPRTPWGLIGLLPLFTGLVRSCPAYTLLGFSTQPARERTAS